MANTNKSINFYKKEKEVSKVSNLLNENFN